MSLTFAAAGKLNPSLRDNERIQAKMRELGQRRWVCCLAIGYPDHQTVLPAKSKQKAIL